MNTVKKSEPTPYQAATALEEKWERLWQEYELTYICRLPEWYSEGQ